MCKHFDDTVFFWNVSQILLVFLNKSKLKLRGVFWLNMLISSRPHGCAQSVAKWYDAATARRRRRSCWNASSGPLPTPPPQAPLSSTVHPCLSWSRRTISQQVCSPPRPPSDPPPRQPKASCLTDKLAIILPILLSKTNCPPMLWTCVVQSWSADRVSITFRQSPSIRGEWTCIFFNCVNWQVFKFCP